MIVGSPGWQAQAESSDCHFAPLQGAWAQPVQATQHGEFVPQHDYW